MVHAIVCVQLVMQKQENVPNVKEDINWSVEIVLNVQQEHILQEEQQQHVVIVDMENTVKIKQLLVQHVQQVHMDQMKQMAFVVHVLLENIHQVEHKNALIVLQHVEENVLHQQVNAQNVLLDMDFQVGHVQHVEVENIQLEEQEHVKHVHQRVIHLDVK